MQDTRPGSPGSGAYLRGISGSFLAMGMASAAIMTDFLVKGIGPAAGAPLFPGHYSSNSYLFPAGLCERLIAKPCYLGSAFRAATLDEHAAVAHAQRVAGRELRRAAVMAERVGEQQLADMLGDLSPLPQRLDLRTPLPRRNSSSSISSATNLAIISSLTPSALICWAISLCFGSTAAPFIAGLISTSLLRFPC